MSFKFNKLIEGMKLKLKQDRIKIVSQFFFVFFYYMKKNKLQNKEKMNKFFKQKRENLRQNYC